MTPSSPAVEFVLNGASVSIRDAPPGTTLLDCLRQRGLTGAKEGCAEGECGACTVAVVADDGGRTAYRTANSCLMLLPMAAHHEIYTVESLAVGGRLAEVQQALADGGGSQCGYCTTGFVMSLFAEQYRPDRTGPCEPLALAGNLCRCTGYRPIRDAARSLGATGRDAFAERLARPAPSIGGAASPGFSRPTSLDACVAMLRADPDAVPIAGGTDMGVESNLHGRRWPHLVSLEAIAELREVRESPASITIGAAVTLTDIGQRWRQAPPALAEWLTLFASPPIRNRATLGGNLATASPIGDAAPLLLALDADVHVAGAQGGRTLPLASFFTGYRRTVLQRGEILTGVEVPLPVPASFRFYKVSKRRLDDISTVAAAMAVDVDASGRVRHARLAFGGVAATPVRLVEAERTITGLAWSEATVARARQVLEKTVDPIGDHRGSREYRLQVASSLVEKFWWETRP